MQNEDARRGPEHVSVSLKRITPGMVLAKDLVTGKGRLLVTKGTELTAALVEKVLNFNRIDPIGGPVPAIIRPDRVS